MVFGSPELSVFDDVGVAVKTASSIPSPWFSMMQKVAAESRSYEKMVFVGGALAPNLSSSMTQGHSGSGSDNSEPLDFR